MRDTQLVQHTIEQAVDSFIQLALIVAFVVDYIAQLDQFDVFVRLFFDFLSSHGFWHRVVGRKRHAALVFEALGFFLGRLTRMTRNVVAILYLPGR
jgi:hypothetical protein